MYRLFTPVIIPFQGEIKDTRSQASKTYTRDIHMVLTCINNLHLCGDIVIQKPLLVHYTPQACAIVPH